MTLLLKGLLVTLLAVGALAASSCPAVDDPEVDVLLPNPQNCSTYFHCLAGRPILRPCPPGLHFNAQSQQCDFPAAAGCPGATTPAPPAARPEGVACPPPGEGDLVLLPSPNNCSQYLACDNGQAVARDCPPGLHFNPESLVCEFPWAAGCRKVQIHLRMPGKPKRTQPPPTTQDCPPPGDGDLVLFPNPHNCSQYLACDNGQLVQRDCPPGLHFNATSLVCEFPWDAGCEAGHIEIEVARSSATHLLSQAPQCPPPGDGKLLFFPNPENCSTFFVCDNGLLMLHECPVGLHFNPEWRVCEIPWAAGCQAVHIRWKVLPNPQLKKEASVCPPPGNGDLILFPNPQNCSQYLACDNGQLVPRDCPPGLHFNATSLVCEFPWTAGCQKMWKVDPVCRPPGEGDLQIFPDPTDCTKYRVCDNGLIVTRECPDGLEFNASKRVCDFPESAGCRNRRPLYFPPLARRRSTKVNKFVLRHN